MRNGRKWWVFGRRGRRRNIDHTSVFVAQIDETQWETPSLRFSFYLLEKLVTLTIGNCIDTPIWYLTVITENVLHNHFDIHDHSVRNTVVKSTSATGLLPDLHKRLRDTMITCPQFRSNEELRTAFVDARIRPWRDTLPQAANIDSRVRGIINYLYERRNTEGKNALVLCLQVLGECVDPGDALCSELLALADEVEAYLKIGQAKHVSSPPVTKSLTDQKLTPIPTNVVPDVTCKVDMVGLRAELERYDAVQIESLCLDHFSQVYDKFGRGLRRDEMTNLLLDYVRRRPEEAGDYLNCCS